MKKLNVRLIRMIGHSKGQFFSIVAIVAAALSVYVLFNITAVNINQAVDDYYRLTNINDILVQVVRVPDSALEKLKAVDGVKDVQGRLSFDVPLRVADVEEKVNLRLVSVPAKGERINKLYFRSGAYKPLDENQIIILEQFANGRGIKKEDVVTPYINGRLHQLNVVGIAASAEYIYLMENEQALLPNPTKFGIAYVSEKFAQTAYGFEGSYNEVLITLSETANIDDTADRIEEVLKPYGVKRLTKLEDQLSNFVLVQKMQGVEKMANVLPVLFLLVGGLIIVIMLSRMVHNDRIPIGVLKALGYSNSNILFHYAKYALAIGLIGSAIGIVIGLTASGPLSQVFVFYFNIPFVQINVYPAYIISAIGLTSIFCVGSGLIGARGVLQIMPADSMRPEVPKSGKRILLERIKIVWKRINFSWKMVIRNVLRNKRRFVMLVFGLALAYAINTVPLYMGAVMPQMFDLQYNEFQTMDFNIEFARPLNKSIMMDLSHLTEIDHMEPKLEFPFEIKNSWYKKTVSVIGVTKDSEFYNLRDLNNQLVKIEPNQITLTEGLAKALHVSIGDQIRIRNYIPGRDEVTIRVGQIVQQYMGSNAYMEIETMQRLLADRQMITGVAITSTADVKEDLKDIKNISAVRSARDVMDSFAEYLDTMVVATNAYMIFGGILGFAIVYNSTIIGIAERRMEFASLRVMGFDKSDVFRIVTRENILMAIAAIALGIPLGIGMISSMSVAFSSDMITLPAIYSPRIFIIAAIATFVFVGIAQLAARKKIYKMNFIEALKSRIS